MLLGLYMTVLIRDAICEHNSVMDDVNIISFSVFLALTVTEARRLVLERHTARLQGDWATELNKIFRA